MEELHAIAQLHRRMLVSLFLVFAALTFPPLLISTSLYFTWSCARLDGALRGDRLRGLSLLLGLLPGLSMIQAMTLDRQMRRRFAHVGLRVSFFVTALELARAEALVRRRRKAPSQPPGPRALVPRAPWELAPDEEVTQLVPALGANVSPATKVLQFSAAQRRPYRQIVTAFPSQR